MSSQPPGRIVKVRQACDCCRKRKIRCDGTHPCANCLSTKLQCTYLLVPKKKGPKGYRCLRHTRPATTVANTPFPIPLARSTSVEPPFQETGLQHHNVTEHRHLPTSHIPDEGISGLNGPLGFRTSPLVSLEVATRCLDAFFMHKYAIMPVLDREQIYASLPFLESRPEQYGLITACCSVMVLSPNILPHSPSSSSSCDGFRAPANGNGNGNGNGMPTSEFLISETIRARQFCNHVETPSLATVHTSFLLFAALFCLGKDNSAWFYIREAMTMLQLLHLDEETTYSSLPSEQHAILARRTFWLLFITERAYALQRHRPLTLHRTIALPTVQPTSFEAAILCGFLDLISLFQNFGDDFLALWNLSPTSSPAAPASLLHLQDLLKFAIPNVSERTETQQADLLISRQWLKTMVWQLCVSKRLLSSSSGDEPMNFHYPVTIARDVVLVSRLLPSQAFEANGIGILEKVFDIGCSLADVLLLESDYMQASALEVGPRDYLMELVRILGTALGGSSKYLRLLATRADECLQVRIRRGFSSTEDEHGMKKFEDDGEIENMEAVYATNGDAAAYEHPIFRGGLGTRTESTLGLVLNSGLNRMDGFSVLILSSGIVEEDLAGGGVQNQDLSYSLLTPDWNSNLGQDLMAFGEAS